MLQSGLLKDVKTIAVIGLSDDPERYSHKVAAYLQENGFRIIPVNPQVADVLGEKSYPDLMSIPGDIRIDLVDIFRKPELVMPHVMETVKRGDAKTVWLQEGITDTEAERYAKEQGLNVISDACIMKAHKARRT